MEKVSVLPIDSGKAIDFKSISYTTSYNSNNNKQAFSAEFYRQIASGQSGNNDHVNGNSNVNTRANKRRNDDQQTMRERNTQARLDDKRIAEQRIKERRNDNSHVSNKVTSSKNSALENKEQYNNKNEVKATNKPDSSAIKSNEINNKNRNNHQDNNQKISNKNKFEKDNTEKTISTAENKPVNDDNVTNDIDSSKKEDKKEDVSTSEQLLALLENAEKALVVDEKDAKSSDNAGDETSTTRVGQQNNGSDEVIANILSTDKENNIINSATNQPSDDDSDLIADISSQRSSILSKLANELSSNDKQQQSNLTANSDKLLIQQTQVIEDGIKQLAQIDSDDAAELKQFLQDKVLTESLSPKDVEGLLKKYLDSQQGREEKALDGKLLSVFKEQIDKNTDSDEISKPIIGQATIKVAKDILHNLQLANANNSATGHKDAAALNAISNDLQTQSTLDNSDNVDALSNNLESNKQDNNSGKAFQVDVLKGENAKIVEKVLNANAAENTVIAATSGDANSKDNQVELQDIRALHAISHKIVDGNAQTQKLNTANQVETIAIHRKDFTSALQDKVMVMVQQKIRQVDIRLDPPELGQMQVRLHLHNDQASVQFVVQHQQAKEVLDQNMPKLKEMLAEQGVNVGDANVGQRNDQASNGDEQGQHSSQGNGFFNEEITEDAQILTANVFNPLAKGVDYYA